MKERFHELAQFVQSLAGPGEVIASAFSAEDSHFIRFNRSAVRQATAVQQADWSLTLIHDGRRVDATTTLSGQGEADREQLRSLLASLRHAIVDAPKDPYLLLPEAPVATERETKGALPDAEQVIDAITDAGRGVDLVGLYAGGPIYKGFANSLGQRNWQQVDNFNLEWCLYHDRDKAVKTAYAGSRWEPEVLSARMAEARKRVALMARPARTLEPGRYRAYLAPATLLLARIAAQADTSIDKAAAQLIHSLFPHLTAADSMGELLAAIDHHEARELHETLTAMTAVTDGFPGATLTTN